MFRTFPNLPALASDLAYDAEQALKAAGWSIESGSSNVSCSTYITARQYIEGDDDEMVQAGRIRISDHDDYHHDGQTVTVRLDTIAEDVTDAETGDFVELRVDGAAYDAMIAEIVSAAAEFPAE